MVTQDTFVSQNDMACGPEWPLMSESSVQCKAGKFRMNQSICHMLLCRSSFRYFSNILYIYVRSARKATDNWQIIGTHSEHFRCETVDVRNVAVQCGEVIIFNLLLLIPYEIGGMGDLKEAV